MHQKAITQPLIWLLFAALLAPAGLFATKRVAYIYGDVAANGTIPSGAAAPYDQMLLDDTGSTGLSIFESTIQGEGYTITQHYDQSLSLDAAFLYQFDVIIFGLHQRVWNTTEQQALDQWIRDGGGILMYSDSAAGGLFSIVGIGNSTGQTAVNSILSNYGMEVAVDQGGGTRGYQASSDTTNPIVFGSLIFEGEGVSPVAVDPNGIAEAIMPLDPANRVSGGNLSIGTSGISISNPIWAVIGHASVGEGNVIAIFDRQPLWNNGPGSDILEEDNQEILRRMVRYLARDYGNSPEWVNLQILSGDPSDFQVSYRQWTGGSGTNGFNYTARNTLFAVEQQDGLGSSDWRIESGLVEDISSTPFGDSESEIVTLRLLPDLAATRWFARVLYEPADGGSLPAVTAGGDQWITTTGSAYLDSTIMNATSQTWTKESGPGTVNFADDSATQTTATFSTAGTYVVTITANGASATAEDTLTVTVVDTADVEIAINSGGSVFSSQTGFSYVADVHFDGGGVDSFPGNAVEGTADDALYNFARSQNSSFAGYSIPVTNGNYLVVLQLAETFFTEDNKRVFDISIEGQLVLDDIDLHQAAPGKWVAIEQAFSTTVSDSVLDIDVSASINNPLINAIIVIDQP
ncbi:MAG: malectin domain-containing carbohydrate-binding protein [Verrucomicrobiota bacterium]